MSLCLWIMTFMLTEEINVMEKKEELSPMMTVEEVMGFLRITRQYLFNITRDGKLPSYKLGRRVLYKREEVEQFIDQLKRL